MLSPRGKKELKINQRRILINSIEIGIPAPEQVFILAQRHTSNGKVVGRVRNSKTLNYKSFTPHRDGLFCERIFGPVQSYICACGKQGPLTTSKGTLNFCPRCEVEYTDQRARRYRVGYIGLVSPVTHIWHLKGRPSYLSLFLGKRKKTLATLAYCNDYLVEQAFSKVDVNRKFSLAKQHRSSPSGGTAGLAQLSCAGPARPPVGELERSSSYGADFFKNRILKGLTEPKVIKGLTLSREQERSKVWYMFRAPPEGGRTLPGTTFRFAKLSMALLSEAEQGQQLPERIPETDFVAKFDEQNLAFATQKFAPEGLDRASFLKSLRYTFRVPPEGGHTERIPKGSTTSLPPSSVHVKYEASQKRTTLSYTRSQTLPFLPSFICEFHLRDGLLSFFDTFPPTEDIPIPVYCQIPRRYPLRDVHKFMADQAFSKVQVEQSSTKGFASKNTLRTDQRSETNLTGRRPGQVIKNSQIFGYKIFDFARTSFDKLVAGQNLGCSASCSAKLSRSKPLANQTGPLLLNRRSNLLAPTGEVLAPKGEHLHELERSSCWPCSASCSAKLSTSRTSSCRRLCVFNLRLNKRMLREAEHAPRPNGKNVSHISIGTVNEKRLSLREVLLSLLLDRVVTTLIGLTPSLATYLNRPDPAIFCFGCSASCSSKLSTSMQSKVGAEPTMVMTRRVGSQVSARTKPSVLVAADETGTFDTPSGQIKSTFRRNDAGSTLQKLAKGEVKNLRFVRGVSSAPNKTEGFVLASHVWTPGVRHGWPCSAEGRARKGLKEISNYGKVKRLNDLLRLKRFPLAKSFWLLSAADVLGPVGAQNTQRNQIVAEHGQAKGKPRAVDNSIRVFERTLDKSGCGPSLSSTKAERLLLLSEAEQEAEHALTLLLNRRGRVSTQNKSSYSKREIVSEDLRFKHAKGFALPVIGESRARLTIRLVFADDWSDLGSLSQAWLANPYRSSSGYRLAAGAAIVGQSIEAYDQRNKARENSNPRLEYISNQGHFENSFRLVACSAKLSTRLTGTTLRPLGTSSFANRNVVPGRVRVATKVVAEPPLRSWVTAGLRPARASRTGSTFRVEFGPQRGHTIAEACSAKLSTRFGESVEDWLEYWFDRWLQNCYAVKPATNLAFVQARLSQSQALRLFGAKSGPVGPWSAYSAKLSTRQRKSKNSTRLEVLTKSKALKSLSLTPLQGQAEVRSGLSKAEQQPTAFVRHTSRPELELRSSGTSKIREQALFKQRILVLSSVGQHFCTLKGPLLLLALRSYALGLTDRPGRNVVPVSRVLSFAEQTTSYTTPFFSHSQTASIKIQLLRSRRLLSEAEQARVQSKIEHAQPTATAGLWPARASGTVMPLRGIATFGVEFVQGLSFAEQELRSANSRRYENFSEAKVKPVLSFAEQDLRSASLGQPELAGTPFRLPELRSGFSSQNNILFGRFTPKLGASARSASLSKRSKARRAQALRRKVAKLNEKQIRSVGPKHNISSYMSKHDQRVKWIKREVFSSDRNQSRGINRPDSNAQPVGSETGLWPVRPSVLSDAYLVDRRRGSCSSKLSTSRRRRPVVFANSVFLSFCDAKSGAEENPTRVGFATQSLGSTSLGDTRIDWLGEAKRKTSTSIVGTTFQLAPKGPKSVLNLDSQIWFPEIITIFKTSEKPHWRTTKQPDAGTTFRLSQKGASLTRPKDECAELLLSKAEHTPRPQKQNPKNKNLIFADDRNAKNYLTNATLFSSPQRGQTELRALVRRTSEAKSDATTSNSIEENILVGDTLSELRSGNSNFSEAKVREARVRPRRGLKNEVERMLSFDEQAPLTNPRFVLAGSTWARRALEKYKDAGLRASLTKLRQLNKSASALRSPFVQTPIELATQPQDGRTKPDIFFGNEDEYGDEEAPVSAIDDEPEINRGELELRSSYGQLLGSRSKVFRTDFYPPKGGNVQPRLVEQNTTAPVAGKGGTDSYMKAQLDLQAIQEVLSYTGGGALRELLRCFDTQAFSVILLNEIKLLREYHKGYFVYEYDQVSPKTMGNCWPGSCSASLSKKLSKASKSFARVREATIWLQSNQMLEVTEGRPEAGWAEGPRTPLERPLLREADQVDSAEGFVRRRKLNKSASTPRSASTKAEHALTLLQNRNGFVKPARPSKTKQSEKDNQTEYDTNYEELPEEINRFSRAIHRNARRLKIVQLLMRNKRRPEWMLISALPVLPPDLRPILQMSENLIVASDLNTLYQRVIYRNNRQYKLRIVEWSYATSLQRLVQDAVDRLIENGKGGSKPFLTPGGRPLKSLSDTLKGKKGRFRLNLLGKRVDFSGRSVIVVSPHLKIHECGLPREMALELYQYLLIRQMLLKRQVSSVILAKRVIRQQKAFVWDTLRELIYHHPILLNRAPTLHRLGIQAFQPKLVLGSTILLHPLVCAGFNADFDGDQMGVHLPLCDEARAEAWDLLWSRNNLLSPATGEPILLPSQDMVLGFYHMTALLPSRYATSTARTKPSVLLAVRSARSIARSAAKTERRRGSGFVQIDARPTQVRTPVLFEKGLRKSHFFSPLDVVRAYQNGDLDIHTPIWLQWNGKIENNDSDQTPLEVRLTSFGVSTQLYPSYKSRKDAISKSTATFNLFIRTTPGRVIVNNIFLAPTGQLLAFGQQELRSAFSTDRYNTAN